MRVSLIAIAGGVGLTYAQSLGNVPSCALPCVLQYTTGSTIAGCNNLDAACICANQSFISNIACCLVSVCDEADQQAATSYADQLCKANGVIVPTAVSCTSTIVSSTGTPSSTGTNAATTAVTTSSSSGTVSPHSATSTSSSTASTTTKNAGNQNVVGLGAGILGGLAAAAALL